MYFHNLGCYKWLADTSSSLCIDLIFTSLPNLVIDSGVHSSLYLNRHHQLVYAKFNLKATYRHPYLQDVWHYKDANIELIRRAIDKFNWTRAFSNASVSEKVNSTILNIPRNFIRHEIFRWDDKTPPWFNKKIKGINKEKNNAVKTYWNNSSNTVLKNCLRHLLLNVINKNFTTKSQTN